MKHKNIFWGLIFIAGAGIFALSMMGLLGTLSWWTIAVSVVVAACLIQSLISLEWAGVFFSAGLLVWLFRTPIEGWLMPNNSITIWPLFGIVLLLTIGFSIIFPKRRWNKSGCQSGCGKWDIHSFNGSTSETVTGEKLYFKERFTGTSKYITSENLSYVQITNSFGGMEVYFDNATLAPEGATVEIYNRFGGLELYVPRSWNIVDRMSNTFSGVDCPATQQNPGAPTLTLTGVSTFGGVDVKLV